MVAARAGICPGELRRKGFAGAIADDSRFQKWNADRDRRKGRRYFNYRMRGRFAGYAPCLRNALRGGVIPFKSISNARRNLDLSIGYNRD